MSSHTPGPWGCVDTSNHAHDYRLTKPDGSFLPVNAPYNDHSEQRANAHLIAAAPELLAALEGLLDLAECEASTRLECGAEADERKELDRLLCASRAAIAKAKGGAA